MTMKSTLFMFCRDAYYFMVRMGKNVFDASSRLLVAGSPTNINVTSYLTDALSRRNETNCEAACASVPQPELYLDTCMFDCFYPNGGQINRNNAFGEYYFGEYYVDDHVSF